MQRVINIKMPAWGDRLKLPAISLDFNLSFLQSVPGIIKIAHTVIGLICLTVIALYCQMYNPLTGRNLGIQCSNDCAFFLLVSYSSFVTSIVMLTAGVFSYFTASFLPKTAFEFSYHLVSTILYLASSLNLLVTLLKNRDEKGSFSEPYSEAKIGASVREWTSVLRKEQFQLDRQIRAIEREEQKVKKTLKDAAKRGDIDVCKILAKEVVNARKSINRIHTSKAHINSVQMSMNHQLATLRLAGALEKSTEVMKSMENLVKIPEISKTMQELSKEMMKAGIIEEMMEDTFESAFDDDELEEEADKEVDKVLWELTAGQLGTAPAAVSESLPDAEVEGATASTSVVHDADLADMQERLEALRS